MIEESDHKSVRLAPYQTMSVINWYFEVSLAKILDEAFRKSSHEVSRQILHPEAVLGLLLHIVLGKLVVGVGILKMENFDEIFVFPEEFYDNLIDEVDILWFEISASMAKNLARLALPTNIFLFL